MSDTRAAHRARRELARPQGKQGRKATKAASKAARPELASSQACAHIKRSRAQAYKTRKGASQKKNNQGRKLSLYIQGRGEARGDDRRTTDEIKGSELYTPGVHENSHSALSMNHQSNN